MSLHSVLSAMRALILDGLDIPAELPARTDFYRGKFPGLSPEELEDLSLIPPEKFGIYTSTVFSGQKGTLEMHFPMSLTLLEKRLGKPFDCFQLVQKIHSSHPWKGYATEGLAESFVRFLQEDQDYSKNAPELPDLAASEYMSLEIARGYNPFDKGIPRNFPAVYSTSEIQALQIGDLLQAPLFVAENVRFLQTSYDILEIRHDYLLNDKSVPSEPLGPGEYFIVGGRDSEQYVRWCEVSPGFFKLLKKVQVGKSHAVEDLAEIFLAEETALSDPRPSEQELFQSFLSRMWTLISNGSLFILAPASQ